MSTLLVFLGDYIAFADGQYNLVVSTKLYSFNLDLNVQGKHVAAKQSEPVHECVPGITWKITEWDQPTVTAAPRAIRIILKGPEFKATKSDERLLAIK
jgi:hypothetical protein